MLIGIIFEWIKKSKLIVQYDLEFKFIHYYKQSKNAKRRHERVRSHSMKQNKREWHGHQWQKNKNEKEKAIYVILENQKGSWSRLT